MDRSPCRPSSIPVPRSVRAAPAKPAGQPESAVPSRLAKPSSSSSGPDSLNRLRQGSQISPSESSTRMTLTKPASQPSRSSSQQSIPESSARVMTTKPSATESSARPTPSRSSSQQSIPESTSRVKPTSQEISSRAARSTELTTRSTSAKSVAQESSVRSTLMRMPSQPPPESSARQSLVRQPSQPPATESSTRTPLTRSTTQESSAKVTSVKLSTHESSPRPSLVRQSSTVESTARATEFAAKLERAQKEAAKEVEEERNKMAEERAKLTEEKAKLAEEKQRLSEEMRALVETAEIATVDKEMAEEKFEQLLLEHSELKDKFEELTLDFELLKNEVESGPPKTEIEGDASSIDILRLQQQNAKYNEAILKLRDLSAADKHEIQNLTKETKELTTELEKAKKVIEKNQHDQQNLELMVAELKEQVDCGLSAQDMVNQLTEKNLALEDRVKDMSEEIEYLEGLRDLNEEIQEGLRESELELREELDMIRSKNSILKKTIEDNQEMMANYEATISKFRVLVAKVRQEIVALKSTENTSLGQQHDQQIENIEFTKRFTESKAFARAIDSDLRRLELAQLRKHVELVSKFLPQSFFISGGDNDAIQVLLLLPRVQEKCDIIGRQIQEKFPLLEQDQVEQLITSESVVKCNEKVRQQSFTRRLLFILSSVKTVLSHFTDAFKAGSVEMYLKVTSVLADLIIQEKKIDYYIDLLKRDQLDETVSLESIEKALNYFISVYNLHLADNRVNDCRSLLVNFVDVMKTGIESGYVDSLIIDVCLDKNGESGRSLKNVFTSISDVRELSKKIKKHVFLEQLTINLPHQLQNEIRDCLVQMNKAIMSLSSMKNIVVDRCIEKTTETGEVSIIGEICELSAELNTPTDGFSLLEASFTDIIAVCSQLSTGLQQGDFDIDANKTSDSLVEERTNPLETRAELITAQSGKVNEYKSKLEAKETEVNELKKALKTKLSEMDQMQIRKNMVEGRLNQDYKKAIEQIEQLKMDVSDLRETIRNKEKEFDITLNAQKDDIDALEADKKELRERNKILSKRAIYDALMNKTSPTGSLVSHTSSNLSSPNKSPSSRTVIAADSDYNHQIISLRKALQNSSDEIFSLKLKLVHEQSNNVQTISVNGVRQNKFVGDEVKLKKRELMSKLSKVKGELRSMVFDEKIFEPDEPLNDQMISQRLAQKVAYEKYVTVVEECRKFLAENKHSSFSLV